MAFILSLFIQFSLYGATCRESLTVSEVNFSHETVLTEDARDGIIDIELKKAGFGRIKRWRLKSKILKSCQTTRHCNQTDVENIVEEAIEKVKASKGMMTNRMIVMLIYGTSVAAFTYGTELMPDSAKPAIVGLTLLISPIITSFGSPVLEWLWGKMRKLGFRQGATQISIHRDVMSKHLDRWRKSSAVLESTALYGRQIIKDLIIMTDPLLIAARHELDYPDGHLRAAELIALSLYNVRNLFPDIDVRDKDFLINFRELFTSRLSDPRDWAEPILDRLKVIDPDFNSPEVREYYEGLVKLLLRSKT